MTYFRREPPPSARTESRRAAPLCHGNRRRPRVAGCCRARGHVLLAQLVQPHLELLDSRHSACVLEQLAATLDQLRFHSPPNLYPAGEHAPRVPRRLNVRSQSAFRSVSLKNNECGSRATPNQSGPPALGCLQRKIVEKGGGLLWNICKKLNQLRPIRVFAWAKVEERPCRRTRRGQP